MPNACDKDREAVGLIASTERANVAGCLRGWEGLSDQGRRDFLTSKLLRMRCTGDGRPATAADPAMLLRQIKTGGLRDIG